MLFRNRVILINEHHEVTFNGLTVCKNILVFSGQRIQFLVQNPGTFRVPRCHGLACLTVRFTRAERYSSMMNAAPSNFGQVRLPRPFSP